MRCPYLTQTPGLRIALGSLLALLALTLGCEENKDFAAVLPVELLISPLDMTFPAIAVGEQVSLPVTIANVGQAQAQVRLSMTGGSAPDEFAFADPSQASGVLNVEPGQTLVVELTYAPKDIEQDTGNLRVIYNNDAQADVALDTIKIEPDLEITPPRITFERVRPGNTVYEDVNLRNVGFATLELSSIRFDDSNSDFALCGTESWGNPENCDSEDSATLAPGESIVARVRYSPSTDGEDLITIHIDSNDPDTPEASIDVVANAARPCIVLLGDNPIDFGATYVGNLVSRTVTLQNCSLNKDLDIASITLAEDGGDVFTVSVPETSALPATLQPQDTLVFIVSYTPVAEVLSGGRIDIASNDPDPEESPLQLRVSGVGSLDVCPGFSEACNGIDDDCDGEIDEGQLNACGTCDAVCGDDTDWTVPNGGLGGGETQGLVESEGEVPGFRLGRAAVTFPYLWVANSVDNTVSKINTRSGMEIERYQVGSNPSRTTVDLSGHVWVANRNSANVHRIRSEDGCSGQDCVDAPIAVGGGPRGLAIDANNHVWVGSWSDNQVSRINPETMMIEATINLETGVYGMTTDNNGQLWISGRTTGELVQIDIESETVVGAYAPPTPASLYGIAVDGAGRVWLGNFSANNVLRYDPADGSWDVFSDPAASYTRGVAVDGEGFVWVANSTSNNISRFRAEDGALIGTYAAGSRPIGVAIDTDNNVWAVNQGSNDAYQFDSDGGFLTSTPVGSGPYTYSDMTGFQLRTFAARQGLWTSPTIDCGYTLCAFHEVTWSGIVPEQTSIKIQARTSTDGLIWSPWSFLSELETAPLELPHGRFAQVRAKLETEETEASPILQSASIAWTVIE